MCFTSGPKKTQLASIACEVLVCEVARQFASSWKSQETTISSCAAGTKVRGKCAGELLQHTPGLIQGSASRFLAFAEENANVPQVVLFRPIFAAQHPLLPI